MVIKRGFYLLLGLSSLFLGLLGIALPLLPTVPFILLAAFCFARSSSRLHDWLMTHPWFADALQNWHSERAIRRGLKRKAYIATCLSFSVSIILVPLLWVKLTLLAMLTGLLLYLRQIPELDD
ncbi:YbaN family protein [Shewanella aegiceratis]|uniref:YbaN family protein n=1 Tax=Shewanella aegiceratis TaxID=2864203 RepID=UPI001C65D06B|nr:YbaN family protein [Shewanella aegiceratis]QYJ80945.1 YbaN family protein [Shewanella aegiceratis]